MQGTIVVADRSPLSYPGDTGGLTDMVNNLTPEVKNIAAGLIAGYVGGALIAKKHKVATAIAGAAILYFAKPFK